MTEHADSPTGLEETVRQLAEGGPPAAEKYFKDLDKAFKKEPDEATTRYGYLRGTELLQALSRIALDAFGTQPGRACRCIEVLNVCRKWIAFDSRGQIPFPLFTANGVTETQLNDILPILMLTLVVVAADKADKAAGRALERGPLAELVARMVREQGFEAGLPGLFRTEPSADLPAPLAKALQALRRQVAMYAGSATVMSHSAKATNPRMTGHAGITAKIHETVRARLGQSNRAAGLSSFTHPRRRIAVSGNNAALLAVDAVIKCGLAAPELIADKMFPGLVSACPASAFGAPDEDAKQIILPLLIDGVEQDVVATPVMSAQMLYGITEGMRRRLAAKAPCPAHSFVSHIDGNPQNAGVLIADNAMSRDGSLIRLDSLPPSPPREDGRGLAYRLVMGTITLGQIAAGSLTGAGEMLDDLAAAAREAGRNTYKLGKFRRQAAATARIALARLWRAAEHLPEVMPEAGPACHGPLARFLTAASGGTPLADDSDLLALARQVALPLAMALSKRETEVDSRIRNDLDLACLDCLQSILRFRRT